MGSRIGRPRRQIQIEFVYGASDLIKLKGLQKTLRTIDKASGALEALNGSLDQSGQDMNGLSGSTEELTASIGEIAGQSDTAPP